MSEEPSNQARVVLMTHPAEGAASFARRLVEERLAACVNLVPVTSVYRWEGAVSEDAEVLLVAKSASPWLPALEAFLNEHHPYEVPECLALEPREVTPTYLRWWLEGLGAPAS